METNATEATSNRSYENFEPYCKWLTEEGQETLEIKLKGFKKDELKVRTDHWGILTICGERPVDASNNKWSRFHKEIRISKGCNNMHAIRAKFSHGFLSITMPKAVMKKHFICGVETRKRTSTVKVAIGVVVVVALGTYIARMVSSKLTAP